MTIKINKQIYFINFEFAEKFILGTDVDIELDIGEGTDLILFKDPLFKDIIKLRVLPEYINRVYHDINIFYLEKLKNDELDHESKLVKEKIEFELRQKEKKEVDDLMNSQKLQHMQKIKDESNKQSEKVATSDLTKDAEKAIELDSLRKEQYKRIKNAFLNNLRMFECSNEIIMNCQLQDSYNLENGINRALNKDHHTIVVNDYYNNDHAVKIQDAQQMVNQMQDFFYLARGTKQNLYNDIKLASTKEEILSIRFKI